MITLNSLSKRGNFDSLSADSYFRDTNTCGRCPVVLWQTKKKKEGGKKKKNESSKLNMLFCTK